MLFHLSYTAWRGEGGGTWEEGEEGEGSEK